ncbi:MAG: LysM peptidoglycan-binding domain-containing protein [Winogradskyella sp.]|uniref:glucosaminidase domain-containing protein n=1 Tax=Winogradskyella sp. TaxID=1883156 RepID=UPI000F41D221|nr:glucosaminidase domain-containing protein [Winogradskyella sp.]RNC87631.1 MAG: LysM peptidoglycan-binding domain-containing protein [Winogradskyella sp.]
MKIRILIVIISCFILGCGPKKGVVTKKKNSKEKTEIEAVKKETEKTPEPTSKPKEKPVKKRTSVDNYIDTYAAIAMDEMRTSKIPASITLAQGILESGSGNGRLAKEANNHFGIKCHGWKGQKIYHDDDRRQECFRKYKAAATSYKDHSEFLTGRKRYAGLFKLKPTDYKGWARGLKVAGYATDRKYPQKLISLIERYELYKYDQQVLGAKTDVKVDTEVTAIKHIVVKGDTLYSLSKRYGLAVDTIKSTNNLNSNTLSLGQVLLIKSNN